MQIPFSSDFCGQNNQERPDCHIQVTPVSAHQKLNTEFLGKPLPMLAKTTSPSGHPGQPCSHHARLVVPRWWSKPKPGDLKEIRHSRDPSKATAIGNSFGCLLGIYGRCSTLFGQTRMFLVLIWFPQSHYAKPPTKATKTTNPLSINPFQKANANKQQERKDIVNGGKIEQAVLSLCSGIPFDERNVCTCVLYVCRRCSAEV